jgi:hypothetical protein
MSTIRNTWSVGAIAVATAALLGLTPALLAAQRAGSCRVDSTAEWYKSQKAFYSMQGETWSNDSLRNALLAAAGYDAKTAFVPELGWRLERSTAGQVDSSAVALLRSMAQRRQWPTRSLVGVAGVHAAWLIAQHDSALTVAAMHRMMEAGPGESSPAVVAVLEDARRVSIGRGQIHGTQFRRDGSRIVLAGRLEDSVHVDLRREGAWLPPIDVSTCLAGALSK